MTIFTIGHSNHSIETFIALLKQHGITAVADVRSSPYSHRFPHFNQASLKTALNTANIAYVFLGNNLGARPNDRSCYVEGVARYDLIAVTEAFATGLNRLVKGTEEHQITLMCAEQDPIVCHRSILVCPHLQKAGLEIKHIHKNGELESHELLERRLLKIHHLDKLLPASPDSNHDNQSGKQLSLFDINPYDRNYQEMAPIAKPLLREELIQKAYQLQGEKIAYVENIELEQSHESAS
ncbi:DUF488 domain-containing protein [Desmonostoc muscorum LEGE 12446]|uniref:DUF488 domain-containing protein n=1 Tax=Desmonostoc muscorum LEGE 12446 TaxID=1828758 RepID=A0A8J6ZKJ7_DESMC|nr:DUF488 domain-containing protein [Desmonostoc muscorum]MCF2151036.1 DUF488 domain-containing protein [Desmonostoc muscorum LEGE 12446]